MIKKNVDIFIEGGCINFKSYIIVYCVYKVVNIELKINYIMRIIIKEFLLLWLYVLKLNIILFIFDKNVLIFVKW